MLVFRTTFLEIGRVYLHQLCRCLGEIKKLLPLFLMETNWVVINIILLLVWHFLLFLKLKRYIRTCIVEIWWW